MALVSVREVAAAATSGRGDGGEGGLDAAMAAWRRERGERLARAQRLSAAAARGLGLAALATFPIMAAFHIDVDPEVKLDFDLGSILWLALLPAALLALLNALRLGRARRLLDETSRSPRAPQRR
jgi:hypothetical protein